MGEGPGPLGSGRGTAGGTPGVQKGTCVHLGVLGPPETFSSPVREGSGAQHGGWGLSG